MNQLPVTADTTGTAIAYPKHDIAPALKDEKWGRDYAKAVWADWQYSIPRTCFYNAADKYEENRLYAQGKQPIEQYKKRMGVDEQTDDTFTNVDWSVRPFVVKYRDLAISRLMQLIYNVIATPIDPEARGELAGVYAAMRARIAMRQMTQGSDISQHTELQQRPGDPWDEEELEMRIDFGEQFNRSKDAELAIQLGFYDNDLEQMVRSWAESFFDCGPAGYREWLDKETNRPKARPVNPEAVISSYSHWADFRDMVHAGEIIDEAVVDLATKMRPEGTRVFTDEDLITLQTDVAGRWSNASLVTRGTNYFKGYDKWKVKVLDLYFFSWNDYHYNLWVNSHGNLEFEWKDAPASPQGKRKYRGKRIKVVYGVKWIIGTDYVYDFRLEQDPKRSNDPKKKAETSLPFRFYATNFYEMRCLSMMDRLRPLADDFQLTIMRIQNLKARLIPNGFWIDLDALESAALSKGGIQMTTMQLLQMFYDTGILVGRSKDIMGESNNNFKPVIPLQNSIAAELVGLYQDLLQTVQQAEAMVGFNQATAGQTINPKTLNGAVQQMTQSTDNALYPMQFGIKYLMQSLAGDILVRTQQALRKGQVAGYAPALGTNTLRFMEVSPTINARQYGIMLEEKPTEDQKQILIQQMGIDQKEGLIDTSDVIMIMNTYNVKQAQQMLAYKVKKNRQAMETSKQQSEQATIQGQQQSAVVSSQMHIAEIRAKGEEDRKTADVVGAWAEKAAAIKAKTTLDANDARIVADIILQAMQGGQAGGQPTQPGQSQQQGQVQPNPGPSPQGNGGQ